MLSVLKDSQYLRSVVCRLMPQYHDNRLPVHADVRPAVMTAAKHTTFLRPLGKRKRRWIFASSSSASPVGVIQPGQRRSNVDLQPFGPNKTVIFPRGSKGTLGSANNRLKVE